MEKGKKIITGLGIAGGVLGVVGGIMSIAQTADQMKNGIKLREDQLDAIADRVSGTVCNYIAINNEELFASILNNKK